MAKTVQKQLFISSMVPRLLVKKHLADRQLDDIAMTVSFGRQVSVKVGQVSVDQTFFDQKTRNLQNEN
jgi:hypothetical protein